MNKDRFKFRVWDKVNERYLPTCDIAIDCGFRVYLWDKEHDEWVWYSNDPLIEQCTGIRDKHGKLIYEGDIVSINHSSKSQVKCIVEWGCGLTGYYCTGIKGYQYWNLASSDGPYIEIIGNIHEKEGADKWNSKI